MTVTEAEVSTLSEMRVMDRSGDTKIIWDRANPDEVENARRTFNELRTGKRFQAFRVNRRGDKGELIREFDPEAEAIILAPPMVGG